MTLSRHARPFAFTPFAFTLFATLAALSCAMLALAQDQAPKTYAELPSETPAKFEAPTDRFDYVKRSVMIPMRDGVKLNTVIIVPKGAKSSPILLTGTPYDDAELTNHAESAHLGPILQGYDNATDTIDWLVKNIPETNG